MKRTRQVLCTVQTRALEEDGVRKIRGTAAVFGKEYLVGGYVYERMMDTAFNKSLADGKDLKVLAHHNDEKPIASTRAGSARFWTDKEGLQFEAIVNPDLDASVKVYNEAKAGLLGGASVGFYTVNGKETVTHNWRDGKDLIEVHEADLWEASPVTWPASPTTTVEARDDDMTQEAAIRRLERIAGNGDNAEHTTEEPAGTEPDHSAAGSRALIARLRYAQYELDRKERNRCVTS